VEQTTQAAGDAVRPVAPGVSQAVEQTGQVVGDTVAGAGRIVDGVLGGLGAGRT
jgi:hypothetical protein